MARPEKKDVDYFPFYVKDGRTLFILESKYGCKGTGFFTNVMRFLCQSPDHYFSINTETDKLYFFSKTKCDEESGMDMLSIMSKTGKIDAGLWVSGAVIVSPDLLNSISDAYRKRNNKIITIEEIKQKVVTDAGNDISGDGNPQVSGVTGGDNTQSKVKKSKEKKNPLKPPFSEIQQKRFKCFWQAYPNRKSKGQAEKAFLKIDPDEQLLASMIATIERAKTHDPQWLKDNGQFIPHPATWLNARGWEDEIVENQETSGEGNISAWLKRKQLEMEAGGHGIV